jgi:hypothetical protein
VAGHERQLGPLELAVDDMEVGAADAAGGHLEQHLAGPRTGRLDLGRPKR